MLYVQRGSAQHLNIQIAKKELSILRHQCLNKEQTQKQYMALASLKLWSTFSVLLLNISSSFRRRSFPSQSNKFKPLQQGEKCLCSF